MDTKWLSSGLCFKSMSENQLQLVKDFIHHPAFKSFNLQHAVEDLKDGDSRIAYAVSFISKAGYTLEPEHWILVKSMLSLSGSPLNWVSCISLAYVTHQNAKLKEFARWSMADYVGKQLNSEGIIFSKGEEEVERLYMALKSSVDDYIFKTVKQDYSSKMDLAIENFNNFWRDKLYKLNSLCFRLRKTNETLEQELEKAKFQILVLKDDRSRDYESHVSKSNFGENEFGTHIQFRLKDTRKFIYKLINLTKLINSKWKDIKDTKFSILSQLHQIKRAINKLNKEENWTSFYESDLEEEEQEPSWEMKLAEFEQEEQLAKEMEKIQDEAQKIDWTEEDFKKKFEYEWNKDMENYVRSSLEYIKTNYKNPTDVARAVTLIMTDLEYMKKYKKFPKESERSRIKNLLKK